MGLAAQTVFRGTDAEVWMEGKWQTNVTSVEATAEITSTDVNLLGHLWTQARNVGMKGTGTMKGVFVSSHFLEKIGAITTGAEFRTSIIVKNKNPDTGKTYRVELKNVIFGSIPLVNFAAGAISEQDFSFTFSGYEILDKV
jgi:hypothetical protein